MTASRCIFNMVKNGNPEAYYVATAEEALVTSLEFLPLVPIVTGSAIKKPSQYQKEAAMNAP